MSLPPPPNGKQDGKHTIQVTDELLAAFTEGNVNAEEAVAVIKAARKDPNIKKILETSFKIEEDMRKNASQEQGGKEEKDDRRHGGIEFLDVDGETHLESLSRPLGEEPVFLSKDEIESMMPHSKSEPRVTYLGDYDKKTVSKGRWHQEEQESQRANGGRKISTVETEDGHTLNIDTDDREIDVTEFLFGSPKESEMDGKEVTPDEDQQESEDRKDSEERSQGFRRGR